MGNNPNKSYMSKKIILIISAVLVAFAAISFIAKSFCNPSKEDAATAVTSFVEKNVPKSSSLDISNMRLSWILFFSKFCENGASNQKF